MTQVGQISVEAKLDSSKFNSELDKMQKNIKSSAVGVEKQLGKINNFAKGLIAFVAADRAIGQTVQQLKNCYMEAGEAIRVERQLGQTLQSTGYASGMTREQLINLASSMQDLTGINDEMVKSAENIMLTFRNIGQDIFPQAITSAANMSATMGTGLNSAVTQLGKALNDPIKGVTALQRVGVQFTTQQREQIRTLVKSGQGLQAQKLILAELEREFGGAAQSARMNISVINNNLSDFREEIGRTINSRAPFAEFLVDMTEGFKDLAYRIRIATSAAEDFENIGDVQARLQQLNRDEQNVVDKKNGPLGAFIKRGSNSELTEINNKRADLYKRMGDLKKQESAQAKKSAETQRGLKFNTGSEGKHKKQTDKSLDEYKRFIELYKNFNNEYESTVKARQTVQNRHGLSPVGKDAEQFDVLVKLYAEKYRRIGEIEMSQAKNKNDLYLMNEQQFQKELAEYKIGKAEETKQKLYDLGKGYNEQTVAFGDNKEVYNEMGGFLGSFSSGYAQRLEILKWYYSERKRIAQESEGDLQSAQEAYSQLDTLKNAKMAQANLDVWSQYGHEVSGIFGNTFSSLLSGQTNFGDLMRNLYGQLGSELLKIVWQQTLKEIEMEQVKQNTLLAIKKAYGVVKGLVGAVMGFVTGGPAGGAAGLLTSVGAVAHSGHKFVKYHSGGVNYSSYDVPGTAEQLALIKGGERVLSPAENVSYEQGNTGGSNFTVLNFNVKAWDGKDVIKTLRENASLIQQITASGIKNNQNGLRTVVQGV